MYQVPGSDYKRFSQRYILFLARRMEACHQQQITVLSIQPNLGPPSEKYLLCCEQVLMFRLKSGHTHLTYPYHHRIPPTCTSCKCSLSIKHVLLECPRLKGHRENLSPISSTLLTITKYYLI